MTPTCSRTCSDMQEFIGAVDHLIF
jgi:hypothetical protein